MSAFKTSALALAILASVAAVPAQAAPVASAVSVVSFENFKLSWVGPTLNRQVNAATDFSTLSVNSSQLTAANMTGAVGSTMNPSSSTGADIKALSSVGTVDPVINSSGGLGSITASQAFNVPTLPLTGNFSISASNETGAPILNFPSTTSPVTANADLHNASYASLDSLNGTAGTSTSSTLASTVDFRAAVGGNILNFNFDLGKYVAAFLDAGAAQTAFASWGVSISLFDTTFGAAVPLVAFQNLSNQISNNKPGSGVTEVPVGGNPALLNSSLTGGFVDLTNISFNSFVPIIAGNTYQLQATISTRTQVERAAVPEPGALALVGLALAALGITRRNQKRA